ncbi:MAG: 16S rRNA (adenine(1518)-N(6)/adenine(1519)-N(6))-dimethyltransferase RsmA [Acidobacteriota bacterium]
MNSRPALPPPLRRFGQNFLADPHLAQLLVDRFAPQAHDRIVEIGPGRGALTEPLALRAGHLVALEIDERQVSALRATFSNNARVEVRQADALQIDFAALSRELGGPLRVIGNLPYNVGTAIVRRLVAVPQVSDMQFVLQKEVVDRLLATPATKAYGALSVIVAWMMDLERVMTLAPGAFHPRPKVTSAAVRLVRRSPASVPPDRLDLLEKWVHRGFAHRRKMLATNLPEQRRRVLELLQAEGMPADVRAEAIPPRAWLRLAEQLECSA